MQLAKLFSLVVLISLFTSVDAVAQLRERWSARREAREERLNRLDQAASPRNPPAPNPAQSRSMPANPSVKPPNAATANRANQNPAAGAPRSNAGSNVRNAAPTNSLQNNTTTAGKVTTAAASSAARATPSSKPTNDRGSDKPLASKVAFVPDPIPKNSIGYRGPGVTIEMPRELEGEVKFLIDETEVLSLTPGEKTDLKTKGEYIVRFSRGETKEKSFGEAHYTITEGTYRFAVTVRGWELYRQPDSTNTEVAEKGDSKDLSSQKASTADSTQTDKLQPTELDEIKEGKNESQPENDQVEELPRPEPKAPSVVVPEPKPIASKKEEPRSIIER